MTMETRSKKRVALRRADSQPDETAAAPGATTTTAITALSAPKRRATAAKVTRGKIAVKGKVSADKVQKSARAKKGENAKGGNGANKVQRYTATKRPSVQTAKPKAGGKKAAEEDEVKDEKLRPGRQHGIDPKPRTATKGREKEKPTKALNKVQKSVGTRSQPARNEKQKTSKAKKETKANEMINGSKPKKKNPVSEKSGKRLGIDVPKVDKANQDQTQTPGKEEGKENA